MKISTRTRYAVRLMVDLAMNESEEHVLLKDISRRQEISEKYLSQIMMPLRTAGLVTSFRGAKGGYSLGRPSESITIRDIVESMEGGLNVVECVPNPSVCTRSSTCATQSVWNAVGAAIAQTLQSITLSELARSQRAIKAAATDYSI